MTYRILHILDHSLPLHSGYTFRSASILREQHKLGWQTWHLTSPRQERCTVAEESADGLHFYRTPVPAGWMAGQPVLGLFAEMRATEQRLLQLAREIRPDILHAHSPVLNAIPAIRVGRRLGIPVVYEVRAFWEDAAVDHGSTREGSLRYRLTRALETWALRHADWVTTICEGLRQDMLARGGIHPNRITVIPNAVDAQGFQFAPAPDQELRARLGLEGATVLGFVGSFYGYEGLDLLVDALALLAPQHPDLKLLLVGGGMQEANLRAQVERLGLAGRVLFVGRVPHAEVGRYYSLIDLLCYPRKAMRLTELVTPLKPLEAMAQGKLLVASDVGGHRELIRDGETGALFRAGSPPALAEAVERTLAQRDRWEAVRAAGRRYVDEERNWAVSVARYQTAYQTLSGKTG
ncbi:MAG: glycosyltransferase, exosortase A system-associated [Betaproteobacteria bacterium]|nr:glycosyltransferase, exosortase A system-associated [Betaproteobacteria bacterium]